MINFRKTILNIRAFTFIELIIVIAILAILSSLIIGNFINSLKSARDAKRKSDLKEIQNALETYYENNKQYPSSLNFGSILKDNNNRIYIKNLPNDPKNSCSYKYLTNPVNPNYYYLLSNLERSFENFSNISQTGFKDPTTGTSLQCGNCTCKFYLSSPNAIPLTPAL